MSGDGFTPETFDYSTLFSGVSNLMKSHYCSNLMRLPFEKPCSADLDRSNWDYSLRVHAKWLFFYHLLVLPLTSSTT